MLKPGPWVAESESSRFCCFLAFRAERRRCFCVLVQEREVNSVTPRTGYGQAPSHVARHAAAAAMLRAKPDHIRAPRRTDRNVAQRVHLGARTLRREHPTGARTRAWERGKAPRCHAEPGNRAGSAPSTAQEPEAPAHEKHIDMDLGLCASRCADDRYGFSRKQLALDSITCASNTLCHPSSAPAL